MAEQTAIEWCDATFNGWWGCERVSPACAHCYADDVATRYHGKIWGAGHDFRFFGDTHWNEPIRWARRLPAKLGRRPRVFTASMADVFEDRPELEPHRERLLTLIQETPELDCLVLTKRPEAMRDRYFAGGWTLTPNLWIGTSIENARYTWRADVLREIPAAIRFISAEPLLGSIFPKQTLTKPIDVDALMRDGTIRQRQPRGNLDLDGIDWVIAGGESGPKARPTNPEWFRELRDACVAADVAYLFKQWGAWVPSGFVSKRGSEDFPRAKTTTVGGWTMMNVGKKAAGRELDGRTWDEIPASPALVAA